MCHIVIIPPPNQPIASFIELEVTMLDHQGLKSQSHLQTILVKMCLIQSQSQSRCRDVKNLYVAALIAVTNKTMIIINILKQHKKTWSILFMIFLIND